MFLSKYRPLLVKGIHFARATPATSLSLFHTHRVAHQAASIDNNVTTIGSHHNAALSALSHRIGLGQLSPDLLQQAVTHSTCDAEHNNQALAFLGKQAIFYYATEHIHCRYPDLPVDAFNYAVSVYTSAKATTSLGHQLGLQHVMRWERPQSIEDSVVDGQGYALCSCINALVGAVYQEQGPNAAKKMIHDYILSNKSLDLQPAFRKMDAKRHLSAVLTRSKKQGAVSRLLSETGRKSCAPVFVVGVFSGKEKLGEGFGSSLKMAEHRACRDALVRHYAHLQMDYTLPSDAHLVDAYAPPILGDTEAIV